MGDLNLPFEPCDEVPFTDLNYLVSSGVVILDSVVDVGDTPMPALVFRFAKPDGSGFHMTTMLVADAPDLLRLPELLHQSIDASVKAAQDRGSRRG